MSAGRAFRAFVEKGLEGISPGRRTLAALASIAINVALIAAIANIALDGMRRSGPRR